MSKILVTIGLEVHVQLGTKTKIFCGCAVEYGSAANKNVCPVCLGLPGALPVLNGDVFELGLRGVLALGGTPSTLVKFDRKNYFYPDLPKGYQISQYDHPLGRGGYIEVTSQDTTKKIRINRLHLEEDAGKLLHDQVPDASVVDLNRAGTPLAEIVSEPDLESPEEAYQYLMTLKALMRAVGASDCDMEKGQLRCDANVSIRRNQSDPLGRRVEVKNLNSFKAVRAAIIYEIGRQTELLEKGEKLPQETRLWDDARQKTFSMRSKEEAHDYRYFPEPDLVPFFVSAEKIEAVKRKLPELPKAKEERFAATYGLNAYDVKILNLDPDVAAFFESCVQKGAKAKTVANWLTGPIAAFLNAQGLIFSECRLSEDHLLQMIALVDSQKISFQAAKEKLLPEVLTHQKDPQVVMKEKGLEQVSDTGQLDGWIKEVIVSNPKVVADFKSGKDTAAMFLLGQVMKKSQGKANPIKVKELMIEKLNQS